MSSARFPLSGVGASPLQTSRLLGRTSLSPPLPASFFGGLGFFPLDTQMHMLISPALMEMTFHPHKWERKNCHLLGFSTLV